MAKRITPPVNSTLAMGRALPTTPTNRPTRKPFPDGRISTHDGRVLLVDAMLMSHRPMMAAGYARIGFFVDHLNDTHQRLLDAGVHCVTPPERRFDLWVALYEDPDGIYFTLAEPAH